MKILVFISILAAAAMVGCSGTAQNAQRQDAKNLKLLEDNTADPSYLKGRKALAEGRYQEAIELLEQSNDEETPFLKALALKGLGKTSESKKLLETSADKGIQKAEAYFNLGLISYEAGDTQEALHYMSKVLEIDKRHPGALYYRASVKYAAGDIDGAEADYILVTKVDARNFEGWNGLFFCRMVKGDTARAWELRERVDQSIPEVLYNLLVAGEKNGRYTEALELLTGAKAASLETEMLKPILLTGAGKIADALKSAQLLFVKIKDAYIVTGRGVVQKLSWVASITREGKTTVTCFPSPGKEPQVILYNLGSDGKITALSSAYENFARFIETLPDLCKAK